MKLCKIHGKQPPAFGFCPYCGSKLVEEKEKTKYTLHKSKYSEDGMENLALKEAAAAAWMEIGVYGNVAHMLAEAKVKPKEIQEALKRFSISGIGTASDSVISQLNESDFKKFDETFGRLTEKGSWCWNLAEWFYSLNDGCTNGEYMTKKVQFIKMYKDSFKTT